MTTSPTAELRAAANILVTLDSHLHGPGLLADAEAQAFIAKYGIEPHALAVVRAILGGRP